jgi:FkbM family methyltransferase
MERAIPSLVNERPVTTAIEPALAGAGFVERVRWFLRRRGWDLRRFIAQGSKDAHLALVMRHLRIRTVLDAGAGPGAFGRLLRELGYEGTIVSFEAYAPSHRRLQAAAAGDPRWHVMPPMALGEAERSAVALHVASNADSSSLLEMLDTHREALPGIRPTHTATVDMTTLDAALGAHPGIALEPVLLKVDTQGSELRILEGARETLPRLAALHIELSLVGLYRGAPLAREVLAHPLLADFDLWAAWPSFVRAADGRTLQVDAILVRRGAGAPAADPPC